MGLEKAIAHGKEKRKNYMGKRKSASFDRSCRNHGKCDYCKGSRLYQYNKAKAAAVQKELE